MHMQNALKHYLRVLRQHGWLILLGVALSTSTTYIASLFVPVTYQATALIKVNSTTSGDALNAQAITVDYALLVTSSDVLQRTQRTFPGMTLQQLKEAVHDSPVSNTQIIEIRTQAHGAQQATDIANAVAAEFIQVQIEHETARLQKTTDGLKKDIVQARLDVDMARRKLTSMQEKQEANEVLTQQKSIVDTYQTNYTQLLSGYSQLQQQKVLVANILSIAQVATRPEQPINPQIFQNTLLAALLSTLVMIVLACLMDWLDTRIRTVEDVHNLAGLPALGSIPLMVDARQVHSLLTSRKHPLYEAFTLLGAVFRTRQQEPYGPHTLLVTSPHSQAGTSTTALHLATTLAASGVRVLLIDANMSHPQLHQWLKVANTHGFMNHMHEFVGDDGIQAGRLYAWLNQWQTSIADLWLLPAGPTTEQSTIPIEALKRLQRQLLGKEMKQKTEERLIDLIIVDTAALEQGSTTATLAAIADATLLVIEAGREQREALQRAHEMLSQLGAPVSGVVINRQRAYHYPYHYVEPQEVRQEVTMRRGKEASVQAQRPSTQAASSAHVMQVSQESRVVPRLHLPAMQQKGKHVLTSKTPVSVPFGRKQQPPHERMVTAVAEQKPTGKIPVSGIPFTGVLSETPFPLPVPLRSQDVPRKAGTSPQPAIQKRQFQSLIPAHNARLLTQQK